MFASLRDCIVSTHCTYHKLFKEIIDLDLKRASMNQTNVTLFLLTYVKLTATPTYGASLTLYVSQIHCYSCSRSPDETRS